jgi:hypothetical protein
MVMASQSAQQHRGSGRLDQEGNDDCNILHLGLVAASEAL